MPWQKVCTMKARMRLVAAEGSMAVLCEEYRVSRETGYK